MKMAKNCQILHQPDTPMPSHRSARLGGPEPGFLLRLGEPLRLGVAKLRLSVLASQVLVPLFR